MSRGARSVALTKARFTGPLAFPDSLLFPPPGEAKCVRGPSGLGASRAEEKGASLLARAGMLAKSPPSPFGLRNTAFPIHWPSDISSGANQAPSHGLHESRDTKHESRPFIVCFDRRVVGNAGYGTPKPRPTVFHESRVTKHGFFSKHGFFCPGCATGGSTGNRRPDHCPRRQAAVLLYAIVHHCSPLFSKKIVLAIVLAPPGRCFLARCGAAWGGYGAAWAAAVPRAGNTACKVFTNHETRITRHESRPLRFSSHDFPRFPGISHDFPAPHPPGKGSARRSVAAFLRVVARHRAAMARHGRPPSPAPATRPVRFSRITRHESRITAFIRPPLPPGAGVRAPSAAAPVALRTPSAAADPQ